MKILSINVKKMTRYRGNNHAYLRKKDIGTIKKVSFFRPTTWPSWALRSSIIVNNV
jgi:hypothetical protein